MAGVRVVVPGGFDTNLDLQHAAGSTTRYTRETNEAMPARSSGNVNGVTNRSSAKSATHAIAGCLPPSTGTATHCCAGPLPTDGVAGRA